MPVQPDEVSVKMSRRVYKLVKAAAGGLGLHVQDFLDRIAEPAARKALEEITRTADPASKGKKGK